MSLKLRTISLPDELDQQAAAAAHDDRKTYSAWTRELIERAVTGKNRLANLQDIAAEGLRQYADAHGPRERLNATEVIASPESCADGRGRLAALEKIAAGRT